MNRLFAASLLTSVCLAGCPAPNQGDFDQAELDRFRSALPTMDQLTASTPQASVAAALGDPAVLPTSSYELVTGINGSVEAIITVLDLVTSLPPTVFNSATNEFLWGPFPNEQSVGTVAVFVRDTAGRGDFRYEYALLRGTDNDVASMTPVILGGATPDESNDDHGVGITLWDFEADRRFEEANNPNFENMALAQGRFITVYGAGPDENNPAAEVAMVVAAFRDFVPEEDPSAPAVDLDYLYGRYAEDGVTVDFLDWQAPIDVNDPLDGTAEDVGVRMAFLNEGAGRAEADAINGSLAADQRSELVECWDNSISQTFLSIEVLRGGQSEASATEGDLASCGLFQPTLSELGVPSLEDVPAELLTALDEAATNGIGQ